MSPGSHCWVGLEEWFSTCGPWTSRIRVIWEIVRNADFQVQPRQTGSETQKVGLSDICLINLIGDSDAR